jgi:hypothetical protein
MRTKVSVFKRRLFLHEAVRREFGKEVVISHFLPITQTFAILGVPSFIHPETALFYDSYPTTYPPI